MSAYHSRRNRYGRDSAGETASMDRIVDFVIFFLVLAAICLIQSVAIPGINATRGYTAETIEFDYGLTGIFAALLHTPPVEWFRTKLFSFELPAYHWYTAVLLAVMVQVVTADLQTYLGLKWLYRLDKRLFAVGTALKSWLMTWLMVALLRLSLLVFCPQNIPLLVQAAEVALFCLPALIHGIFRSVRRSGKRKRTSRPVRLAFLLADSLITVFLINHAVLCTLALAVLEYARTVLEKQEKEIASPDQAQPVVRLVWFGVTAGYLILVGSGFAPYVRENAPEVETHEVDVYVSAIETNGKSDLFIRTDGTAVDRDNRAYLEDVVQTAICTSNRFFLQSSGDLSVCSAPGHAPKLFMTGVRWIDAYGDVLVAVDRQGDLWGFGDLTRYMPEGAYAGEPTLLVRDLHLTKADIGQGHILMLTRSGDLYGMGENRTGELGTGTCSLLPHAPVRILSGVREAKASLGFSFALKDDGTVWAWGRNDVGQLGVGVEISRYTLGKGYAVNEGLAFTAEPVQLSFTDTPIVQIGVGAESAYALDSEHRLWVWGKDINRESVAKPTVHKTGVLFVADCKAQRGIIEQRCYYVAANQKAYLTDLGSSLSAEGEETVLVIDRPWLPEPYRIISTRIEDMLNRILVFPEQEKEEEPEEVPVTNLRMPLREDTSCQVKAFDGHMYQIIPENMYLKNAESYCESMGGHLVTITSREEHDMVSAMVQAAEREHGRYFIIGLTNDGGLSWVTGESAAYVRSLSIQPAYTLSNGEGYINENGKINIGAMIRHPFICEWDFAE